MYAGPLSFQVPVAGQPQEATDMSTVALQGRITISNANEMRRKLADALRPRPLELIVDLSGVCYMDTSGLATLIEAKRIALQQSTRLILGRLQEQPRFLFSVTDLDHVFQLEEPANP
jgi:anti-anti-sigma factor